MVTIIAEMSQLPIHVYLCNLVYIGFGSFQVGSPPLTYDLA
jgi:hypothetical protein